jgi:hypothetical protein
VAADPRPTAFKNQNSLLRPSVLFSYSCKLFGISQIANSFIFNYFQTLCQKHPGGGYPSADSTFRRQPARLQHRLHFQRL